MILSYLVLRLLLVRHHYVYSIYVALALILLYLRCYLYSLYDCSVHNAPTPYCLVFGLIPHCPFSLKFPNSVFIWYLDNHLMSLLLPYYAVFAIHLRRCYRQ